MWMRLRTVLGWGGDRVPRVVASCSMTVPERLVQSRGARSSGGVGRGGEGEGVEGGWAWGWSAGRLEGTPRGDGKVQNWVVVTVARLPQGSEKPVTYPLQNCICISPVLKEAVFSFRLI